MKTTKLLGTIFVALAITLNLYSLYLHFSKDFLAPTKTTLIATFSWFVSIISFGSSVFLLSSPPKRKPTAFTLEEKIIFWALLFLGLFLRIYKLTHLGIYIDEKYWLNEAKAILNGTVKTPFGFIGDQPANMPAYLVAFLLAVFKNPYYAVRLPGAIYSLFNIVFVFYFLKEAFNKRVALLSTLLLSTSIWDIHMSGFGWNNVNLNPFLISGAVLFLYQGIKLRSPRDIFICGIFLGTAVNMLYIASLCLIPTILYFFYHLLFDKQKKRILTLFLLLLASIFIVSSPTFIKIKKDPQRSIGRHKSFVQENVQYSQQDQNHFIYYLKQFKFALEDFTYRQENFTKHGLWGTSLDPFTSLALALGLLFSLPKIISPPYFLMILNCLVMFIPIVVLYRFTSLWREHSFLPTVYMFASLGIDFLTSIIVKMINFIHSRMDKFIVGKTVTVLLIITYSLLWSRLYYQYYNFHLKQNLDLYESYCKKTAEYLEDNVPQKTTIILPEENCKDLISTVLGDKYIYRTYKAPMELFNLAKEKSVIVYINAPSSGKTRKEDLEQAIKKINIFFKIQKVVDETGKEYANIYIL